MTNDEDGGGCRDSMILTWTWGEVSCVDLVMGIAYAAGMVPMRDIKRYCDKVAAAFQPQKIILFGSYAYGRPTEDSDVDVMVVMPKKRYRRDLGWRIPVKVPPTFPVDVLVVPDDRLQRRLEDRESFILDVTEKGRVMYEGGHA